MHDDQLDITPEIVRSLVGDQFPQWRSWPVRQLTASEGTVNGIFRIGDALTARFPLVPGDPADVRRELEAEADASAELAGRTRFPTPEPVALGDPGHGYPLPWSVQTWLPGTVATVADPGESTAFAEDLAESTAFAEDLAESTAFAEDLAESTAFAEDLAEFIAGVRTIDTRGRTFSGGGRGGDLKNSDGWLEFCFDRSAGLLDVRWLRAMWAEFRELPRTSPDVMSHKDLIPGNVLVADGRLAGVLDVGGLGPADPALDLVSAWHLLEAGPRQTMRERLGCDDLDWERGRAWAFAQAMGLPWYYADTNPVMARLGVRTLARLMS